MEAGPLDWEARTNADFSDTLTYKIDGTPVNLTGYTAKMQVRKSPGDTVVLELSTANGRLILGGVAGTVDLLADKTVLAAVSPGRYVYDLVLTSGSGLDVPLLAGVFTVVAGVTVV